MICSRINTISALTVEIVVYLAICVFNNKARSLSFIIQASNIKVEEMAVEYCQGEDYRIAAINISIKLSLKKMQLL